MEVAINREIRDYQASIFFGLSLRQCIFSLLAAGTAVGVYFALRESMNGELVGWICILCAAPFAALGFLKYHSMPFEQLILAILRSELLIPERLLFVPENTYADILLPALEQRRKG